MAEEPKVTIEPHPDACPAEAECPMMQAAPLDMIMHEAVVGMGIAFIVGALTATLVSYAFSKKYTE